MLIESVAMILLVRFSSVIHLGGSVMAFTSITMLDVTIVAYMKLQTGGFHTVILLIGYWGQTSPVFHIVVSNRLLMWLQAFPNI